jgi:hypothetical protein
MPPALFASFIFTINYNFGGTGVWTWCFALVRQAFKHLSPTSSPLVIFDTGSHIDVQAGWTAVLLFMRPTYLGPSHSAVG